MTFENTGLRPSSCPNENSGVRTSITTSPSSR
jgi:hypothetical protein